MSPYYIKRVILVDNSRIQVILGDSGNEDWELPLLFTIEDLQHLAELKTWF